MADQTPTFRKEVFYNKKDKRWEYNIYAPNGDKCIYQDFDPDVCGAEKMTEERAHQAADAMIVNLTNPPVVEAPAPADAPPADQPV